MQKEMPPSCLKTTLHFLLVISYTHTHPFDGPLSRTTRVTGTRKVEPIWILLKQETESGSGTSWAICKSAPSSRQITTPASHHSVFYRPDAHPATQLLGCKLIKANKFCTAITFSTSMTWWRQTWMVTETSAYAVAIRSEVQRLLAGCDKH